MKQLTSLTVFLLILVSFSLAETVKIPAGTFKVINDYTYHSSFLAFRGKFFAQKEMATMSIEKTYRLKNETVFILSENYGGNGSPPHYFFVTIADNGKYAYSDSFFPGDWTFKPHKVNNSTIRVELGFDGNKKWKYALYKNGEVNIGYDQKHTNHIAKEDCHWLYNSVYKEVALSYKKCGEDIAYSLPGGSARAYIALRKNPSFKEKVFRQLVLDSCRKIHLIPYKKFEKEICLGTATSKMHNQLVKQISQPSSATCISYKVVKVQKLNIRNKPSKRSRVIGRAKRGQKLCVYDFNGKWGRMEKGYISGRYLQKSYPKGNYENLPEWFDAIVTMAEQGNTYAQHFLGNAYETGGFNAGKAFYELNRDWHTALYWYTKSVKSGYTDDYDTLYMLTFRSVAFRATPREKKVVRAIKKPSRRLSVDLREHFLKEEENFLKMLANKGVPGYQMKLGYLYHNQPQIRDYQKAFYWFKKAAKQLNVDALYQLSVMYEFGRGIPKDLEKSRYYRKLALSVDVADPDMEYNGVEEFRMGRNIISYKQALRWYRQQTGSWKKLDRPMLCEALKDFYFQSKDTLVKRYKNGERLHRSDFKVPVKTMGYAEEICKMDHYLEYEDLIRPIRMLEMNGCPKCGDVGFGTLYYAG